MSTPEQHFDAARKFQEFYDNTLRKIGMRAPQPVLGTTVNDYRRETLRTIKKTFLPTDHELYRVQFRGLPADVLNPLRHSFLVPPLPRPIIPRTSPPASYVRLKNLMNTENSKPLNGLAKKAL